MKKTAVLRIVNKIKKINPDAKVSQMKRTEDGTFYLAWSIFYKDEHYLLKKIKSASEENFYRFINGQTAVVPYFYGSTDYYGKRYILLEYVEGKEMNKPTRTDLIHALDALISLQKLFPETKKSEIEEIGDSIETFSKSISARREYLDEALLRQTMDNLTLLYPTLPRTLCHMDLLPFNVITNKSKAVIIDWENFGMFPYLLPFARLIAHTKPNYDWDFVLSIEDKKFAIDYYFSNYAKGLGKTYEEYLNELNYFLFYESTEWVYVGRKYGTFQKSRYQNALECATKLAQIINKI